MIELLRGTCHLLVFLPQTTDPLSVWPRKQWQRNRSDDDDGQPPDVGGCHELDCGPFLRATDDDERGQSDAVRRTETKKRRIHRFQAAGPVGLTNDRTYGRKEDTPSGQPSECLIKRTIWSTDDES